MRYGLSHRERKTLLDNPHWIDQELAERSLADFIRIMWGDIDPAIYRHNWHIDAICEALEAVNRGEIRRLLINIPPRHMKSIMVSVAWPAWTWIQRRGEDGRRWPNIGPETSFIYTSYARDRALRHSSDTRRLIESARYQTFWGDRFQLRKDQNAKHRFDNDRMGFRFATSVRGQLTGEGSSIFCMDDPHDPKGAESDPVRQETIDWWRLTASSRINDRLTGAFVLIMQRLHHQDMTGFLLDQGGWDHICLPARFETDHPHRSVYDIRVEDGDLLWDARFPHHILCEEEETLGSYGAAGQFQQRPSPRSGGLFDRANWQIVDAVPAGGKTVRGWDLAGTEEAKAKKTRAAYTAGCKMTLVGKEFYIEDMVRFRGTPGKVEKTISNVASQDGPAVTIDYPQDPGQAGKGQARYLARGLAGYDVRYSTESGSKEVRATPLSAQQEAGNVYLLRGPWNEALINEAAFFPNSEFSDQIDAASRAFHRLLGRGRHGRVAMTPPEIVSSEV